MPRLALEMDFSFSAAHRLPCYSGRCFNLHGHNYKLTVRVEGEPDPKTGMFLDYGDLEKAAKAAVLDRCDHANLNDFVDNPTAENLVVWMWPRLREKLPGLTEVRLWETRECCVVYRGDP